MTCKTKESVSIKTIKCSACGNAISPEHGGHKCLNCGAFSCCDEQCTPSEFVNGQSTVIPYCKMCRT